MDTLYIRVDDDVIFEHSASFLSLVGVFPRGIRSDVRFPDLYLWNQGIHRILKTLFRAHRVSLRKGGTHKIRTVQCIQSRQHPYNIGMFCQQYLLV